MKILPYHAICVTLALVAQKYPIASTAPIAGSLSAVRQFLYGEIGLAARQRLKVNLIPLSGIKFTRFD